MYASVEVPLTSSSVSVAVPKDSVQKMGEKSVVRVPNEKGEVEVREVKTGRANDKLIEITSGLKPGEKVVSLSYTPIKEGGQIRIPGQSRGKRK